MELLTPEGYDDVEKRAAALKQRGVADAVHYLAEIEAHSEELATKTDALYNDWCKRTMRTYYDKTLGEFRGFTTDETAIYWNEFRRIVQAKEKEESKDRSKYFSIHNEVQ